MAAAVTVAISILSDRLKLRGVILLFALIPAIVGYAVIANIGKQYAHVKYGMTFLMAAGLYSGVPCVLTWNSNNSAGHYKRATTSALQLAIANSGGFVASKFATSRRPPGARGIRDYYVSDSISQLSSTPPLNARSFTKVTLLS